MGLLVFAAGLAWAVVWAVVLERAKKAGADLRDRSTILRRGAIGLPVMLVGLILEAAW